MDFDNPPEAAKPWAYMFGAARNASLEDFPRHVAELKDKGFGGFVTYLGVPPTFAASPRFPLILKEAERHELVMGANNCGLLAGRRRLGFLGAPALGDGQQHTGRRGGRLFHGKLPEPALPADLDRAFQWQLRIKSPNFQEWVRVGVVATVAACAYPLPDRPARTLPKVTASSQTEWVPTLFDGSWNTAWTPAVPAQTGQPMPKDANWILFDFGAPREVEALWVDGPSVYLESSEDGVKFKRIKLGEPKTVYDFPSQRSRYFRVVLAGAPAKPELATVRELALGTRAEVERRIQTASKRSLNLLLGRPLYTDALNAVFKPLAALPDDQPLASKCMVDLTGKVAADGTLEWDVPPGHWRIVWLCRSVANGLEGIMGLPDYLNPEATREDFGKGMGTLATAAGDKAGKVFRCFHEDNNEIHSVYNWTPAMLEEFRKRRGYDATPYLAAMAGEIVDSVEHH